MIIFDLDGTLADCEHRRHFVDASCLPPPWVSYLKAPDSKGRGYSAYNSETGKKWKPDWKSFHEACVYDTPIQPVIQQWDIQIGIGMMNEHQIWSGRCESVREQTEEWLRENLLCFSSEQLKMRPIGDNTPDDELKEKWLDEAIANGHVIEYVFDDRPKVVRMYRRRGIFVFDCNQSGKEF